MQAVRVKINLSRHFLLSLLHYVKLVKVSLNYLERVREISKEAKTCNYIKKFTELAGVIFWSFCMTEISYS
jgi:hypothetical protein